jgi:hypothetical protein
VTHSDFYGIIITEWVFLLTKLDDLLGQYDRVNLFFCRFHAVWKMG